MSSSSDDDIMGLLPGAGRGRGGRGGAGGGAPTRLRNFKAMMSDSSSDDEKKRSKAAKEKKPLPDLVATGKSGGPTPTTSSAPGPLTGASTVVAAAAASSPASSTPQPLPVQAPPRAIAAVGDGADDSADDSDSHSNSNTSIQFLEDEKSSEVSMDLQSTIDDATPPTKKPAATSKAAVVVAEPPSPQRPATPPAAAPVAAAPVVQVAAVKVVDAPLTRSSPPVEPDTRIAAAPVVLTSPASQQPQKVQKVSPPKTRSSTTVGSTSTTPTVARGAGGGGGLFAPASDDSAPTPPPPAQQPPAQATSSETYASQFTAALSNSAAVTYEHDADDDNELLREVLPLHPSTTQRQRQVAVSAVTNPPNTAAAGYVPLPRARSPVANAVVLNGNSGSAPSPRRADPLEELLVRAQQRLKEKERLDQSLSGLPPAAPSSASASLARAPSPLRPGLGGRSLSQQAGTADPVSQSLFVQLPLPESSTSREVRLQRENQRLAEELAFLSKENQRLRSAETQNAANEVTKLQVHVEVLKQQLRDLELDHQRTKQYLESQIEDAQRHEQHLQDEIRSYAATSAQFDVISREKDNRIAEVLQQVAKLQTALQERTQEARRVDEEGKRQRDDDKAKLDRANALFEDVKKQRTQLQELNDKFQKDKETAVSERRKMSEELRNVQAELQRERDRHSDEAAMLRRDVERYRQLLGEKERTLTAQITEERRAKEHFQTRLTELEESVQSETASLQAALRAAQDELRRAADDQGKRAQELASQVHALTSQLDAMQSEFAVKLQKEKALATKEASEKLQVWKDQCAANEERRRVSEEAVEKLTNERDQYRKEWEKCCEINVQWQKAKDKAELQNVQLSASLQQLISQDEQLMQENERYRLELEQALQDVAMMRREMDQAYLLEQQLQDLSAENDRISDECHRVTQERNELIEENARLADEMIKWRNEMKDLFSTSTSLQQKGSRATGGGSLVGVNGNSSANSRLGGTAGTERSSSAAQRTLRTMDFTF